MNHFRNHNSWSINGLHQIKNLCSLQVNRFENIIKPSIFENCNVTCAIWEEIFEDIDDALKNLGFDRFEALLQNFETFYGHFVERQK